MYSAVFAAFEDIWLRWKPKDVISCNDVKNCIETRDVNYISSPISVHNLKEDFIRLFMLRALQDIAMIRLIKS